MYRRGLEIFIRSLGLDRPSTIKVRENLTALLSRWAAAKPMAKWTFFRRDLTPLHRPCKVLARDVTKTFHVKHFCPIEPRNRTKDPYPSDSPSSSESSCGCDRSLQMDANCHFI